MADEWGPWIEHDGKGCPVPPGTIILVEDYSGDVIGPGMVTDKVMSLPHWFRPKPSGLLFETDVRRYRIRKPRGLTILQGLLESLPDRVDA